ncbi:MAG: cysteine desulfurase [Candidatus Nephthysia bennettiae]|nr:aminotransferase class V-fold PLP-dependent enzyme [Candidatus Dormibacteraeota bacterium]PZR96041.1 MAG: cysteine desulfurase [Candidatus Dormibacteraeota bacterium]
MPPSRQPAPAVFSPRRIYLDDAGGAALLAEARAARLAVPEGNPASPHAEGRAARAALDRARDAAAGALGTEAADLVFCASGTEAVNLALLGAGRRLPPGRSLVTWAAEHQSVLGAARQLQLEGRTVHVLGVDGAGFADLDGLPPDAGLVALGLANNEVGTVQPVSELASLARAAGALLFLDCSQGPRWLRPPVELADLAAFSGQKLGAGGGGMLFVRRDVRLQPLQYGGPQEWGKRAGREDVAGAAALATALQVTVRERDARAAAARPLGSRLREALVESGGRLTGGEPRLPNFASATFRDRRGEDLLMALDMAGVAASSGSACASGSLDPSHVLLAMGFSLEEALGSLRLTAGYSTTAEEVERMFHVLQGLPAHA